MYPTNPAPEDEEECEAATSSVCGYTVSYEINQQGSPTAIATTSICEEITGCYAIGASATKTETTTPTPDIKPYVVYLKRPDFKEVVNNIRNHINNLNPRPIYQYESTSRDKNLGTIIIFFNGITDQQADTLRNAPGVRSSTPVAYIS